MVKKLLKKNLQIAIDGPSGGGKSIIAFSLAKELGMEYVYTGVMYRTVAFLARKGKIGINDEKKLLEMIRNTSLNLKKPSKKDRFVDVYINGRDVTGKLFKKKVSEDSSKIATLKKIRTYLVKFQKEIAEGKSVIMDGRDIGSKVLPNADLKIFLTASLHTRARRRWLQLKKIGKPRAFKEVMAEIKKRDIRDMTRKESPLKISPDSWLLDSTNLTIPQIIKAIIKKLQEKGLLK